MKRFEKFTTHHIKLLLKHLNGYSRNNSQETLHQIRVDIKKIKAALGAVGYANPSFKPHKQFLPFRTIFRRAGEIREPDVLQQLSKQYGLSDWVDPGIADRQYLMNAFEKDIPKFVKSIKKRKESLTEYARRVRLKDLVKYAKEKKKDIKSQLSPRPQFHTIHKTRKSIKELIYLSAVSGGLKRKETAAFEKVEDAIGRLHDKQVLATLLTHQGKTEETAYDVIQGEILSDREVIQKLAKDLY